jgi:hypothetical protein
LIAAAGQVATGLDDAKPVGRATCLQVLTPVRPRTIPSCLLVSIISIYIANQFVGSFTAPQTETKVLRGEEIAKETLVLIHMTTCWCLHVL